jgi:hypothetical protein
VRTCGTRPGRDPMRKRLAPDKGRFPANVTVIGQPTSVTRNAGYRIMRVQDEAAVDRAGLTPAVARPKTAAAPPRGHRGYPIPPET